MPVYLMEFLPRVPYIHLEQVSWPSCRWQATDRKAKKLADKHRKEMDKAHQVWYEYVGVGVVHVSVV
jgi:hypothetical protein